jgi:phosphate transport system substrate-binding protein
MSTNSAAAGGSAPSVIAPKRSMAPVIAVVVVVVIIAAGAAYAWSAGLLGGKASSPHGSCTAPASTTLLGAGSTFVFPLMTEWSSAYTQSSVNYQSVGSGAGITQITAKTVDFGASDAPLTPTQYQAAPGILHVPESAGAVAVIYNVPGVVGPPINVTGAILAQIYLGTITNWQDPSLTAINPKTNLPNATITPVERSDGSGTTYAFTQFLSDDSPQWSSQVGSSTLVSWPTGVEEKGSSGVAAEVKASADSIGYVDLTYALNNGISFAAVKNPAGSFILPSLATASNAVKDGGSGALPSGSQDWNNVSLINEAGASDYPLATFTYLLVYKDLGTAYGSSYNLAKAENLVDFLGWVLTTGQTYSAQLYYVPLPASVVTLDQATVASMTFNGQAIPSCVPA